MVSSDTTILLVEDDPGHAALIRHALECVRPSVRIMHVADGETAIDYLFEKGSYAVPGTAPRPGVVLLDLRLPRIDGIEVLRAVKTCEALWSIPVVVLTTSSADLDVATAYANHANSYLVKPFGFDEFRHMLEDLDRYWCTWNTPAPAARAMAAVYTVPAS